MSGDALTAAAPRRLGWHGKLPCRGDFLTGGAPLVLIEGWRAWALAGVSTLAGAPEPARAAFLTAPLWRFAVTPGVFASAGGVGVMGPGADRAGRLFPFVIVVEAGIADPEAALEAAEDWLDAVEAGYLRALDPGCDPAGLGPSFAGAPALPEGEATGRSGVFRSQAPADRRVACHGAADARLFSALFGPDPAS